MLKKKHKSLQTDTPYILSYLYTFYLYENTHKLTMVTRLGSAGAHSKSPSKRVHSEATICSNNASPVTYIMYNIYVVHDIQQNDQHYAFSIGEQAYKHNV